MARHWLTWTARQIGGLVILGALFGAMYGTGLVVVEILRRQP